MQPKVKIAGLEQLLKTSIFPPGLRCLENLKPSEKNVTQSLTFILDGSESYYSSKILNHACHANEAAVSQLLSWAEWHEKKKSSKSMRAPLKEEPVNKDV